MSVKISDLTEVQPEVSTDSVELSRDNGDGTFSSFRAPAQFGDYEKIGEISYFYADPGVKYLRSNGDQYLEAEYPELASSGLTPYQIDPSGVSGATFLSYSSISGDSQFGISGPRFQVKYDSQRVFTSSNGYKSAMILINDDTVRQWITFNDGGALGNLTNLQNVQIFPSLDDGTHMPAFAKTTSSKLAKFRVPNNIDPTATGDVIVTVADYQEFDNTDIVNGSGNMDTSYCSTRMHAFYDNVNSEYVIMCLDGSSPHIITSTDFVAFTYEATLSADSRYYFAKQSSTGEIFGSGFLGTYRWFPTVADLKIDNGNTVAGILGVDANVYTGGGFDFAESLSKWIVCASKDTTNFDGTVNFYDGATNTYDTFVFDQPTYGIDFSSTNVRVPEVSSVQSGVLISIDNIDKVFYFDSAIAPAEVADYSADSAVYVSGGLHHFDPVSLTLSVHTGNNLQYAVRYSIQQSGTTMYYTPDVPDAGEGKAYIRAKN